MIAYSREDYPEYHDWIASLCKPHEFNSCQMEEYDSATGLIAAVGAGRGVAMVASSMQCLAGPRLKLLSFSPALPPLVVGALFSPPPGVLAAQFILAVKQAAKETSLLLLGRRAA